MSVREKWQFFLAVFVKIGLRKSERWSTRSTNVRNRKRAKIQRQWQIWLQKYGVVSSDFEKHCTTPRLDDNTEDSNFTKRKCNKNSYRFRNPMLHSRNNELCKIDQESRLLLRELSYASLITSYVDNVVSDQDKTEALQSLI